MLVVAVVTMMLLLHHLTAPGPDGLSIRDIAPWMMLADHPNPPKHLEGLAGLGVDQVVEQEEKKGIVLALRPIVIDDGHNVITSKDLKAPASANSRDDTTPVKDGDVATGVAGGGAGPSVQQQQKARVVVHVGCGWQLRPGGGSRASGGPSMGGGGACDEV